MEQLETRQLLTAYYIDPVVGSDTNSGTIEQPFRTARNLTSWSAAEGNANYRQLVAGDTVNLREGVHDWSSLLTSNPEHCSAALLLRNVHGTETLPITIQAYPNEHPIVKAKVAGAANFAINVLQSSHVKILGLELTGTYGPGIRVSEATDVEIANNYIHDVDGNHDNNIAGIYTVDTIGLHIHHNLLHDNYDHARAQQPGDLIRENSRNIVIFGDGSDRVEVDHNEVFNTPLASGIPTGEGIWIKHASKIPNARFEIHDNIISDVFMSGIGGQTNGIHMYNNLVVNADRFYAIGGANVTAFGGAVLERNTWAGSSAAGLNLGQAYAASNMLEFNGNVVVDDEPLYSEHQGGIIVIDRYGLDRDYDRVVTPGNLRFDQNVYFNPLTSPRWNIYSAYFEPDGVKGGCFDFAGWQALGFDPHSNVADPRFDDSFIPTNPAAQHAGYWASDTPRLAMYVPKAKDVFLESAGANASSVTIVRSGMSLSEPLTVTLWTSDTTEAQLPTTVKFEANQSVLRVPITAINDHRKEPTRAVQLFASAPGNLHASEWVRVLQVPVEPPQGGVQFGYYEGNWIQLPDFSTMTPVKTGSTATFTLAPMNRDWQFGFRYQTTLTVPATGVYTFYLGSDDGSRLSIGKTVVVDNDGLHAFAERQGTIHLDKGRHPLTVEFFESGGQELLTVDYAGPGFARQSIPATVLSQQTPNPPSGVVEFEVANRTVNENDGSVTLTVIRHDGCSGEIDVAYATRNGTAVANQDFAPANGQLQFAYGQTSRTITIGLKDDTLVEPNETFFVDLTTVSGTAKLGSQRSATVLLRDNEPPIVAPRVSGVRLLTTAGGVTGIAVQFDSAMNDASVKKISAYVLAEAGRDGRLGTKDDRSLTLKSVTYDPGTKTATLSFKTRVSRGVPIRLKILSSKIFGANGLTLDGDGNGAPGGDYQRDLRS